MADVSISRLRDALGRVIGPTPWYWKTFPRVESASGQRWAWTHHGSEGALGYVVSLGLINENNQSRLALNTYCRPFFVPPSHLGVRCPEGRNVRLSWFDPDQLKALHLAEIARWFNQSAERTYAVTAPLADIEVPRGLAAGMHKIGVPAEFRSVAELIVPTSYPAKAGDDPAFALYLLYLQAGLVEVLW